MKIERLGGGYGSKTSYQHLYYLFLGLGGRNEVGEMYLLYILSDEKKAGAPQMRDAASFPAAELPQSKLGPMPWSSSLEKYFSIWEGTS